MHTESTVHVPWAQSERPPITVFLIVTRLSIGGPTFALIQLARDLRKHGYRPLLVSGVCEAGEDSLDSLLSPDDAICYISELSRSISPIRNFRAFFRLYRLIRSHRPVIVHTHTAMAGATGRAAAILARTPVIVHTFHGNSLQKYFSPVANFIFRCIEQVLAHFTDAICVLSPQQRRELCDTLRTVDPAKFHIMPLDLDLSKFQELPEPNDDSGPLCIGWFGRFVPIKDIPLLAQVIETSLGRGLNLEFHLVGAGSEAHAIEGAMRKFPGQVHWHGWQKNVIPFLEKCHLVIMTSRSEGTPLALIQGMAAGRPFLSTPVGGVIDLVSGNSIREERGARWFANAILADADPQAFATALEEISHDRAKVCAMGRIAREFAKRFDQNENGAKDTIQLYKHFLEQKLS